MDALNVHALGPSGSGKTVFMASLYSRLRLRRSNLAFYIKTGHDEALSLNAMYNKIANPDESWPIASANVQELEFSLCLPGADQDYEPLSITYLDYPGGILTNPGATADSRIQELVQRLRSAHGLLILLDGMAVRALMRNERLGQRYLEFDLTSSLEIAQQSRCPIHFIITKWDMLGDYDLGEVRDRLVNDDNLGDLLQSKKQDLEANIRLIPVSSVGDGFANLEPNGAMVKTGRKMTPYNVEIPLIAVLPDFLQYAYMSLDRKAMEVEKKSSVGLRSRTANWASSERSAKVGQWVSYVAQRYAPKAMESTLRRNPALAAYFNSHPEVLAMAVSGLADRLGRLAEHRLQVGREVYNAELGEQRLAVRSEREAFDVLEKQFATVLGDFEARYPASVLLGGASAFVEQYSQSDEGLM